MLVDGGEIDDGIDGVARATEDKIALDDTLADEGIANDDEFGDESNGFASEEFMDEDGTTEDEFEDLDRTVSEGARAGSDGTMLEDADGDRIIEEEIENGDGYNNEDEFAIGDGISTGDRFADGDHEAPVDEDGI